jgi:hypothetical protein
MGSASPAATGANGMAAKSPVDVGGGSVLSIAVMKS